MAPRSPVLAKGSVMDTFDQLLDRSQAGWDGIRTIGGGDAVELTGVDAAGRAVVTVPALESRPPAADPTS